MSDYTPPPPKVGLITGASRRIGAEIARHLHRAGLNLVLHYHASADAAAQLQLELEAHRPQSVRLLQADLTATGPATEHSERMISETLRHWGRLDVLVNNASSFYPTAVGGITEQHWQDLMGTNLKAPLFLAQAAAPALRKQQGSIVNLIDIHAQFARRNFAPYTAAKAGLASLTKSLALDLAPEIRVNGVAPGAILWPDDIDAATEADILSRIPLQRQGEPADIAATVVFLIRDARYITGQIIAVDGGRSLSV